MWVIKDEAAGLWAHFCSEGGEHACWSADPGTATQFSTEAEAEAKCVALGINPSWVVPA